MQDGRPVPSDVVGDAAGAPADPAHVRSVIASVCGPRGTGEDLRAIAAALEAARAAGLSRDPDALNAIEAGTATTDPVLRESALAALTGDLRHYAALAAMVRNVMDLAPLDGINQIYWSMQRQIFLMRMDPSSLPDFTGAVLFPFYASLVREVARRFAVEPTVWRPGRGTPRNILLVTNQFLSPLHQPSRDLLQQAVTLQSRGDVTVTILNTNTLPDRYHSPFVPPFAAEIEPALDGDQTVAFEGRSFRILSSAAPGLTAAKVNGFMAAVDALDPEAVVAVGGSVLVADLLASARPTLCLQTTTGHTVSLARLILDFGGSTPPGGGDHYARAWRPFRLGLSLHRNPAPLGRTECGIPDDAFACVVVGNRLDAEVGTEFLDALDRLLDAEPSAFVVFAGPVDALPERVAARRGAARLRCLGHVDRIDGLLSVCDSYLNPRRTGGGASAMQALAAGLPILSLASGDVASVAGPGFCVTDMPAFVARALELARDPEAMARARAESRGRHAALLAEGGDPKRLFTFIEEAQRLFLSEGHASH